MLELEKLNKQQKEELLISLSKNYNDNCEEYINVFNPDLDIFNIYFIDSIKKGSLEIQLKNMYFLDDILKSRLDLIGKVA